MYTQVFILEHEAGGLRERFGGVERLIGIECRSGELMAPPDMFQDALLRITASVSCLGCRHSHLLQPGVLGGDATANKISTEEGRDAG